MNDEKKLYLKEALENENNECIYNLTTEIIKKRKEEILNSLPTTKTKINEFKKKLKEYRHVDELNELHIGAYIRWIKLSENKNEINLTNGGILLNIIFEDKTYLQIKNNLNRIFNISIDKNLVFQKITEQEKIILYAIQNIDKIK